MSREKEVIEQFKKYAIKGRVSPDTLNFLITALNETSSFAIRYKLSPISLWEYENCDELNKIIVKIQSEHLFQSVYIDTNRKLKDFLWIYRFFLKDTFPQNKTVIVAENKKPEKTTDKKNSSSPITKIASTVNNKQVEVSAATKDNVQIFDFNFFPNCNNVTPISVQYTDSYIFETDDWREVFKYLAKCIYEENPTTLKEIRNQYIKELKGYLILSSVTKSESYFSIKLDNGFYMSYSGAYNSLMCDIKYLLDYCGIDYRLVTIKYKNQNDTVTSSAKQEISAKKIPEKIEQSKNKKIENDRETSKDTLINKGSNKGNSGREKSKTSAEELNDFLTYITKNEIRYSMASSHCYFINTKDITLYDLDNISKICPNLCHKIINVESVNYYVFYIEDKSTTQNNSAISKESGIKRITNSIDEDLRNRSPLLYSKVEQFAKIYDAPKGYTASEILSLIGRICTEDKMLDFLKNVSWAIPIDSTHFSFRNDGISSCDAPEVSKTAITSESKKADAEKFITVTHVDITQQSKKYERKKSLDKLTLDYINDGATLRFYSVDQRYYDINKAFDENDVIEIPNSIFVNVGDVLLIFVSYPDKTIKHSCLVTAKNVRWIDTTIDVEELFNDKSAYTKTSYIRVEIIESFYNDTFNFNEIAKVKSGFRTGDSYVSAKFSEYVVKVLKELEKQENKKAVDKREKSKSSTITAQSIEQKNIEPDDFDKEKFMAVITQNTAITLDDLGLDNFRDQYSIMYDENLKFSDAELKYRLKLCGIVIDGAVFAAGSIIDDDTGEKLFAYIDSSFSQGKTIIYFKALYEELSDLFVYCYNLRDENMLREYIKSSPKGKEYYFSDEYITKEKTVTVNHDAELEEYMLSVGKPQSYDQIYAALSHIPSDTVYQLINCNQNLLFDSNNQHFHIDIFNYTESELTAITQILNAKIEEDGYAIWQVCLDSIKQAVPELFEDNPYLSSLGIRNALSKKLAKNFNFESNVICDTRRVLLMKDVFKLFAKNHGSFTMDELSDFAHEINTQVYYDAVSEVSARVNQNLYVAKEQLHFNVYETDKAIDYYLTKDYLPLQEFDSFVLFPSTEYEWNEYLLGAYLKFFSKKYTLLSNSNSKANITGAVVKKACDIRLFSDLCIAILVDSDIDLTRSNALDYLVEKNILNSRRYDRIDDVLENVKRIKRNQE